MFATAQVLTSKRDFRIGSAVDEAAMLTKARGKRYLVAEGLFVYGADRLDSDADSRFQPRK